MREIERLSDALQRSIDAREARKLSDALRDLENKNRHIEGVPDPKDKAAKKKRLVLVLKSYKQYLAEEKVRLRKAIKENNDANLKLYTRAVQKREKDIESMQRRLDKLV